MIELNSVSKVYPNGTHALDNVDLTIEDGEFAFIVGASGAGKSTLIKLLLREEVPTSGSVVVNGFDLVKMKRRHIPAYRRSLGVVFQDFRLIPNMNIYDNVAFALRVTNTPTKEIKKKVPYILNLVGLLSKAKAYPEELSGGEQQRVALARALANNPSIIIADEPTGNVDPKMSLDIMNLLIKIHKRNKTVIVVTHEKNFVDYFQQRVVTIKDGKVADDKVGGMFDE